jgi:AcrR family transcriptional regulator
MISIMGLETVWEAGPPTTDRRVRRSRAALMRAAIELVTERGTAAVPVSDIAEAADVSRRVVYQHFADRDTLLLEAALDLARRELLPVIPDAQSMRSATSGRVRALTVLRHFAAYRGFYRALLTGAGAFALDRGLIGLLLPINRRAIEAAYGERLDPQTVDDLATFLTGGGAAFVTTWVVTGPDPLDPDAFADRLTRAMSVLLAVDSRPVPTTHDLEDRP